MYWVLVYPLQEREIAMTRKVVLVLVSMVFVFSASVVLAQDAELFGLTGKAGGDYPVVLAPDTEYEFAFEVFNSAPAESI